MVLSGDRIEAARLALMERQGLTDSDVPFDPIERAGQWLAFLRADDEVEPAFVGHEESGCETVTFRDDVIATASCAHGIPTFGPYAAWPLDDLGGQP